MRTYKSNAIFEMIFFGLGNVLFYLMLVQHAKVALLFLGIIEHRLLPSVQQSQTDKLKNSIQPQYDHTNHK